MAAAFLSTKGRIFADTLIYKPSSTESTPNEFWIEGNSKLISELQKYLMVFKLRSKVSMEVLSHNIYFNNEISTKSELTSYLQHHASSFLIATVDPRLQGYGSRFIALANTGNYTFVCNNQYKLKFILYVDIQTSQDEGSLEYQQLLWDTIHGLANSRVMVNKIPFEYNLDLQHFINFHKGCYVGQELMARTKYKGMVRKRILPFHLLEDASVSSDGKLSTVNSQELFEKITSSPARSSSPQIGDHIFSSSNQDKSIGEVVYIDSKGLIGLAAVQLDVVFSHSGKYTITSAEGNSYFSDVTIFRPHWFTGLDEKTFLTKD